MNTIRHKYIFLGISGVLVAASIAALALWGLRLGIDFTGGSLLEIEFADERPSAEEAEKALTSLDLGNISIQPVGERGLILRFRDVDESMHQEILSRIVKIQVPISNLQSPVIEKRFDAIGPTIGAELKRRAAVALGLALIAIVAYIAWAFRRVSKPGSNSSATSVIAAAGGSRRLLPDKPVASWKYGVAAIIALIHDVLIPTGVFSVFGRFRGVEADTLFITALLTILGFSVHDTIVVFDRIRENLRNLKRPEQYADTVNRSINETMTRSILTSFTVLIVLGAIFFLGGVSTRYFALTLILGIIFGTYSSIFIASPLLVIWNSLTKRQ